MPAARLGPRDVGATVSLRVTTPGGPTDLVGVLVAADPDHLTVRRRDGREQQVATRTVLTARLVPPSPAQRIGIDELELVMADGWRAAEVERLGDWLLRASGGFTRRANSALAVGSAGVGTVAALEKVRSWYGARHLPPRIQLPVRRDDPLAAVAAAQGWQVEVRTHVMAAELAHVLRAADAGGPRSGPDLTVHVDAAPDDAWLARYRSAAGPLPPAARTLLAAHPDAAVISLRERDAAPVAIARACVDGRWAGLYAVEVDAQRRRRGLARVVTAAALRWAGARGARHTYLQVAVDNTPAVRLYQRLGYVVHHDYLHLSA